MPAIGYRLVLVLGWLSWSLCASAEQPAAESAVDTIAVGGESEAAAPADIAEEPAAVALDVVTVTAQKRKEDLQKVSVSVSVVSGEDIRQRKINNMEQAMRSVPNVTVAGGFASVISIRGLQPPTNAGGLDPSASAIVDDVPLPLAFIGFAFLDLAGIEVLRGPQGTLYGRNNNAGVFKINTYDPEFVFSGSINGQYGDYGSNRLQAVVNVPVIDDTLAVRFKATRERTPGFVRNTYQDINAGAENRGQYGAKILLQPADELKIVSNLLYIDQGYPTGYAIQALKCTPTYLFLGRRFDDQFECDPDQKSSLDYDNEAQWVRAFFGNAVASWMMGDYELKGLVSYYKFDSLTRVDGDYSPIPLVIAPVIAKGDARSAEVRLISPELDFLHRPLTYISGLYYSEDEQYADAPINFVPLCVSGRPLNLGLLGIPGLPALPGSLPGLCDGDSAEAPYLETLGYLRHKLVKELGVFNQAEYSLTDDLRVTAGLRYSQVLTENLYSETRDHCLSVLTTCPLGLAAGIGNRESTGDEVKDRAINFKTALGYAITPRLNTYASVATGFKAGGFGLSIFEDDGGAPYVDKYEPERSINYELGAKTTFLGGQARANLALFWTDFTNFQVLQQNRILGSENANAAGARSRGVELETAFVTASDAGLYRLSMNGSFLDARYVEYKDAKCPPDERGSDDDGDPQTPNTCDLSGRSLPNAPRWKGAFILDAEWPVFDWPVIVTAGFDANWQDRVFHQSNTDPNATQAAFWRFNARTGFKGANGKWSVSAFVENLSNTYNIRNSQALIVPGVYGGYIDTPRWWALSATYSF